MHDSMLSPIVLKTRTRIKMFGECQYCNVSFSNYAVARHEKKCYLNPSISTKIIDYFDKCLSDQNFMMKKVYHDYAKIHKLPNTSILLKLVQESTYWHTVFPWLILSYYEHKVLKDIEKYDILIKVCTLNTYGMNFKNYKKSLDEYIKFNDVDLSEYYFNLYCAVIGRAIRDYIHPSDCDENGELIDKNDAKDFLLEFYPKIIKKIS